MALLAQCPTLASSWVQIKVLETSALKDMDGAAQVIRDCAAVGVSCALMQTPLKGS